MTWQPKTITQLVEARQSSTQVVIVETDAGRGFLKAMGNQEGEHALACDWVGTQLAKWFGLSTFDQAILEVDEFVEITFLNGNFAQQGPALVARALHGDVWSGSVRQLKKLRNQEDISRLVVFDTWILNRDRHSANRVNRDNVFLAAESGTLELMAIDHTHCFGTTGGELTERVARIEHCKDEAVYGLFPEFQKFLNREIVSQCAKRLSKIRISEVEELIAGIPSEWNVSESAKSALTSLILQRAAFVSDSIVQKLFPQGELDFVDNAED